MNFTFFSSADRTFSRIDHILGHKSSLGRFKKTNNLKHLSDNNVVRLDVKYREKLTKYKHMEAKQHTSEKKIRSWKK